MTSYCFAAVRAAYSKGLCWTDKVNPKSHSLKNGAESNISQYPTNMIGPVRAGSKKVRERGTPKKNAKTCLKLLGNRDDT